VHEFKKKWLPRVYTALGVLAILGLVIGMLRPPYQVFTVSNINFADAGDDGFSDGYHKLHVTAAVKSVDFTASPYCSVKALTKGSAEVGLGDGAFSEQEFKVGQTWQLVNDGVHVRDEDMAKIDHVGVTCIDKTLGKI
jgi:hypothetical protein